LVDFGSLAVLPALVCFGATLPAGSQAGGLYCGVVAGAKQPTGKMRRREFGQEDNRNGGDLSQKRMLKMQLKVRRWTLALWEYRLEVSHGLEQRLGVCGLRRLLPVAQPSAQTVQTASQFLT
jgi:hypothetical protein